MLIPRRCSKPWEALTRPLATGPTMMWIGRCGAGGKAFELSIARRPNVASRGRQRAKNARASIRYHATRDQLWTLRKVATRWQMISIALFYPIRAVLRISCHDRQETMGRRSG